MYPEVMKLKSSSPLLFTGGHHNSALVIALELKNKGYPIVWVGHRHTMIGDPHDSLEYQEVTKLGIKFYNLLAGKFHPQAHPIHLFRMPLGFIQAVVILLSTKPQAILAFGGYVAVPIAIVGKLLGIPIIAFEQTSNVGRANKLIGKFSLHNFLAWPSSLKFFPQHKSTVVGLPLNPQLLSSKTEPWFKNNHPIILVTGGKQGSHIINTQIFKLVPQLVKHYNLIHQTGASVKTQDYQQAIKLKDSLSKKFQDRYQVFSHLYTHKMISALKASELVISRSGAHISYELLLLNKKSILIPLPFSYNQEQNQNALILKKAGLAEIIPQSELNPQKLNSSINQRIKKPSKKLSPDQVAPTDANSKVVDFVTHKFPHET